MNATQINEAISQVPEEVVKAIEMNLLKKLETMGIIKACPVGVHEACSSTNKKFVGDTCVCSNTTQF
ncbi:hypothetical protein [Candidatus Uabimicrobium amorphum]|uniref:Uncharacterized protein n=1 Tax=Uabimicrobium amorphum TaxID=2596890 RepID=A0A5S9IIC4_UABAM|nr:hypothetical protein [Candidatus Uabimicrobium amorphum]BBM82369.1 hypothetical protein UABAM_00712 [Candidatus Uabimicrobium amorphum]